MNHSRVLLATIIAAVVAVVGVGAFALTNGPWASSEATDSHAEAPDPLTDDPVIAAQSAMAGLFSWSPAAQESPQAAAAAISDRLTGKLGDYAASGQPDPVVPKEWEAWARSGDRVMAIVEPLDNLPEIDPDSPQATVKVTMKQEVIHADGDTTPFSSGVLEVTVVNVDGQWKAADYEYLSINA